MPVVEADTGLIVVDAKIIVSVKIVAAVVARQVLCSRDIFLLLLFGIFILRAPGMEKQRIKKLQQLTRKGSMNKIFIVSSNNGPFLDMTSVKSFLVTQRSPLVLLQSPWVLLLISFHT